MADGEGKPQEVAGELASYLSDAQKQTLAGAGYIDVEGKDGRTYRLLRALHAPNILLLKNDDRTPEVNYQGCTCGRCRSVAYRDFEAVWCTAGEYAVGYGAPDDYLLVRMLYVQAIGSPGGRGWGYGLQNWR